MDRRLPPLPLTSVTDDEFQELRTQALSRSHSFSGFVTHYQDNFRHKLPDVCQVAQQRPPSANESEDQGSDDKGSSETSTNPVLSLPDTVTTLMLRNLPARVDRARLIQELDAVGFAEHYDFCYVPSDFSTGKAHGIAFVNFSTPEWADQFYAWNGSRRFCQQPPPGGPPLIVLKAKVQGLQANLRNWKASRVRRVKNKNLLPFVG